MRISRWGSVLVAGGVVAGLAACGSGFDDAGAEQDENSALTVLIGSSGEAETKAVEDAVAAWAEESGIDAEVSVASELNQQLAQGFSSGDPADVFYLSTDSLAGYASNGSLLAYGDELENKDDFYPSLVSAFTYEDEFYCAPKDFSTLGLVINTDAWTEAGLTDADIPTDWTQLADVAAKLTTPERKGLVFGAEYQRVGAFMAQAGGTLMSDDNSEATADSPENLEALEYVKQQLTAGTFAFASDVGAGWGGEAFGKGLAAMTIEGNWITGALTNDFPDVNYTVAELPAGPAGKGTLQFTNCWGIAADSDNQDGAKQLVEYLTATEQQLAFSTAFGVMPSIQSAAEQWSTDNPVLVPFLNGAEYAKSVPTAQGANDVVADFNSQLGTLASGDPKALLESTQGNLEAIVE
ncbi:multiple sugar transport system substrate-binding protein [Diaminobutyricimonas aerilata]|uniref:Multiple sugar transport system substrate-binding protein n=1 Tax=Diaminobutyricimonas aerilata TaxID=1162967 RepID=A0A2M9CNJ2_9MICO|nr:extracellular solute-binding protein [Diaminobutyricimonas aerilata]PJJ73467.1 multiple sugar transport system substrate-binding protein [Diaminobutyricimonas aerilata]